MIIRSLILTVGLMLSVNCLAQSQANVSREAIAAHWLPETAATARLYTLAAAQVLRASEGEVSAEAFMQRWQARVDQWEAFVPSAPVTHQLVDGRWGHWVIGQRGDDARARRPFALRWQDMPEVLEGQWWLWQAVVARQVSEIWASVEGINPNDIFAPLIARFDAADPASLNHARAQARRIERMHRAPSARTQALIQRSLILAQAQHEWAGGRQLASVWLALEGLMRLASSNDQQNTRFYANWLDSLPLDDIRALQSLDGQFPVIVALLQDSVRYLLAEDHNQAMQALAQAYGALALIGSGLSAYLDQPVREQLRALYQRCANSSLPITEDVQSECIEQIANLLRNDLESDELVGATGPLSPAFLRRELDLVNWQRARYLDSYLNWQLDSECALPEWFNVLEWNLGVHYLEPLARGAGSEEIVRQLMAQNQTLMAQSTEWLDCIAGVGGERRDIILRLLAEHQQAVDALDEALSRAYDAYAAEALVAEAEIKLDAPVDPQTAYRNAALTIEPCHPSRVCGARATLPVSDGLLDLVPGGYWLAEQLRMGEVNFCYDKVSWIDRQQVPARHNDSGVANYSGRLRFSLEARFERSETTELIFSHRLASQPRAIYFFGQADEDRLSMDCPHGMDGQPIESELSGNDAGLVPDRLTYFTSVPTTTTAHFLANWTQGDDWQSQLAEGHNIDVVHSADDAAILEEVEQTRLELVNRRERALATRLTHSDFEPEDPLMEAMQEVETLTQLLKQALTLHYASIARHDQQLRSVLWGENGLMSPALVRQARDGGVLMRELPSIARQRSATFLEHWRRWPASTRQRGLMAPALQQAHALLAGMFNPEVSDDERPEDR